MTVPGIVLSQPERATTASSAWPMTTSSMESAMTSRETRDARIPSVPIEMPSEIAIVPNSKGVPPASRTPALPSSARGGATPRPVRPPRDARGNRDRAQLERRPAGLADAGLDLFGEGAEGRVAGTEVRPGVDDGHERAGDLLGREARGAQHRARGRPRRPLLHGVAPHDLMRLLSAGKKKAPPPFGVRGGCSMFSFA